MKNFSVVKKLTVSFTAIILLFGILIASVVAIGIRPISNNFSGFYKGPYQTVYTTEQLNKSLNALEKYMLMMITADDTQKSEEYKQNFTDRSTEISEEIAFLQKNLTLQANKDKLNQIVANSNAAKELKAKLLDYSAKGDLENARKLYFSDYVASADASRKISDEINASAKEVASQYYDGARQSETKAYVIIIILMLMILACAIPLSIYIIKSITKPVKEVEGAMKRLSIGDLSADVKYTSKDELGGLADSVRAMVAELKGYVGNIAYVTDEISKGNLAVSVDIDYQNDFAPIKQSMEKIVTSLNDTLSQISASSQQVAAGSEQMSSGAQELAQGATEQASSSEELAASITEMSQRVQENASHSQQASADMSETIREIQQGDTQMKKLVNAMDEIASTSSEIEKIIKAIDDIAFQTNILSLNAAVEAARAGSAGKGFAVVADEVRNLAGKSAAAAKNTTALIQSTLTAIGTGGKMVTETENALSRISSKAESVAKLVDEIAEASSFQAGSVEQINIGINQISSVIQTNSATAEESSASSEELSAQAEMLQTLVSHFKLLNEAAIRSNHQKGDEKYI